MWYLIGTVAVILIGWLLLTIYVERKGPAKAWAFGIPESTRKALIVFDPDPFYNLDEQICASFARALSENNFQVDVQTVAMAEKVTTKSYDLIVYCANTYNWSPDWAITGFIKSHSVAHKEKPIVAITLGAGSTKASQKNFERAISESGGSVLSSYSLWLWRPNDETKLKEPNVDVAVRMAYGWGNSTGQHFRQ